MYVYVAGYSAAQNVYSSDFRITSWLYIESSGDQVCHICMHVCQFFGAIPIHIHVNINFM